MPNLATVTSVPAAGVAAVFDEARAGLVAFNRQFYPAPERHALAAAARDAAGVLVGACAGETEWEATGDGWLHGICSGRRTRTAAPASARGCWRRWNARPRRGGAPATRARLDTLDVQARPSYERHGYRAFGTQQGYPPGRERYFTGKVLAPGRPPNARAP